MGDAKKTATIAGAPNPEDPLGKYWDKKVSELATVSNQAILPEVAERHSIYSLLTLALVNKWWNGNKYGQDGDYPGRQKQKRANGTYAGDKLGDRYLGHNIASIAVASTGEIIDFDFNHNEIFSSSAEHAEARLVRRVFNLNQIYDNWNSGGSGGGYSTVLGDVVVYTSLESCAQCSGIMTLGNVGMVVFLQNDPGQYSIGNIMYNFTKNVGSKAKYGAPEPVDAALFGFSFKNELDNSFKLFRDKLKQDPNAYFYKAPDGKLVQSSSITSFLCTDDAKDIVERATAMLGSMSLSFGSYKPSSNPGTLTNVAALDHCRAFLDYADRRGKRATPHR
jgi:tRNA(Arg) A34 adenosine deaminase TadA